MKDVFSFFFLWLEAWCISFFYKQSVAFIVRRLYIILKILIDLNGFENPYQHMLCVFWRKIKMSSVSKTWHQKLGYIFFVHIMTNKNPVRRCSCFEAGGFLETLANGGGGAGLGRDSPYLCSPPFINFISKTFKRLMLSFQWKLKVHYYERMYLQVVITLRKCSHMCKHILLTSRAELLQEK